MPQLTTHLTIDAPSGRVWQVIGPGFARIGDWATSIPASAAIPAPAAASQAAASAPVMGRACSTGTRLVPRITETLTDYDEQSCTLTYQAGGLPAFITTARVTPAGEAACRVTMTGHFQTHGVLGVLRCWAILAQARLAARHLQADLRYYINHGTPSPRKQRQLSRSRRR